MTGIVKQMTVALRQIAIYKSDHPVARSAAQKAFEAVTAQLAERAVLELGSTEKRLLLDGKPVQGGDSTAVDCNKRFIRHNIAGGQVP